MRAGKLRMSRAFSEEERAMGNNLTCITVLFRLSIHKLKRTLKDATKYKTIPILPIHTDI